MSPSQRWSIAFAMTPRATSVFPRPTSSATRKRRLESCRPVEPLEGVLDGVALERLEAIEHGLDIGALVFV